MPVTQKVKLGVNAKMYEVEGATHTEWPLITDLAVKPTYGKVDVNIRGSRVDAAVKTTMSIAVSGNFKDDGSALANTIINFCVAPDAAKRFLVLNGPRNKVGSTGFLFDAQGTLTDEKQGRGDAIMPDFEIYPTPSDFTPKAVKVVDVGGVATLQVSEIDDGELTFAALV
jgi:hypothetical protein